MLTKNILYSKGKNDDYLTPIYGVNPILKYIPKKAIVWCPFDLNSSNFVKEISKTNEVINSHIDYGQDFYKYEPEHWDILISNPPFMNKRNIFERALSFNKPFALLMTNTWLNDSAPKKLFKNIDLQLLMFNKRILFENDGVVQKKITFSCSYFCRDFLPKQIICEELNK